MKRVFRHDINLHHIAFAAVAVVTQDAISNGEPLFQVDYTDTDNLDVIDDNEELVNKDSNLKDGQDGTNEEEENDDSTAEEDTKDEEFFEAWML